MVDLTIYTDGACSGNPGPGGWGLFAESEGEVVSSEFATSEDTTNNREEMKAILAAFDLIRNLIAEGEILGTVVIKSDSAYCVNMANNWIYTWAKNNWTKKGGIKNLDLVQDLYYNLITEFDNCQVEIQKVAGHAGILGNEIADALATTELDRVKKLIEKFKNE